MKDFAELIAHTKKGLANGVPDTTVEARRRFNAGDSEMVTYFGKALTKAALTCAVLGCAGIDEAVAMLDTALNKGISKHE